MKKLVKCKTCGAEIAKTANRCPQCGARQHQLARTLVGLIIVFAVFGIIASILGGNDEPKLVSDTSSAFTASPAVGTVAQNQNTFGVGEKVSLNNVVATLTDVSESEGTDLFKPSSGNVFVLCSFEIENNSDKDIVVSSLLSFETYIDDYSQNLSLSAMLASEKNQLDGTVAAGKKMAGVVGYEVPEDWKTLEIRFKPDVWSGKDIKFVASK